MSSIQLPSAVGWTDTSLCHFYSVIVHVRLVMLKNDVGLRSRPSHFTETCGCFCCLAGSSVSFPFKKVYTVSVCAGEHVHAMTLNVVVFTMSVIGWNPHSPPPKQLPVALISGSSCLVMVAGTDVEWLHHGPSSAWATFLSSTTQKCMFILSWPHCIPLISVIWPEIMLKHLKPNSFWSLPFHSLFSSSPCPLLPSSLLFFSLLNCKYQVPFILFCYFCYYCYYIVVLVIFFL